MKFNWPQLPSDILHRRSHLGHEFDGIGSGPPSAPTQWKSSSEIKFPLELNCLDWRQAITEEAHLNSCDSPKKKKKKNYKPAV